VKTTQRKRFPSPRPRPGEAAPSFDVYDRCSFNRGVAYAVALLAGTQLQPGIAAQIIHESGITLDEFRASGCDAADMHEIRVLFATESPLRKTWVKS
jgi:hypothetical protein